MPVGESMGDWEMGIILIVVQLMNEDNEHSETTVLHGSRKNNKDTSGI